MASLILPYSDFVAGTGIVSQQVDDNNTAIVNYINARNSGATGWDAISTVGALISTATSNQFVLGTTRTVTISAPTPASASRTHTIPDVSADSSFIMAAGAQTITGAKTFGANIAMGSNKITGVAAGTAAGDALMYGQLFPGKIHQIVSTVAFAGNTIVSTSFTDITGATASITPTATTSKILVLATFSAGADGTQAYWYTLLRGATNLGDATEGWNRMVSPVAGKPVNQMIIYFDSPATTSSTTYKLQGKAASGSMYAGNFSGTIGNNLYLLEIGQG